MAIQRLKSGFTIADRSGLPLLYFIGTIPPELHFCGTEFWCGRCVDSQATGNWQDDPLIRLIGSGRDIWAYDLLSRMTRNCTDSDVAGIGFIAPLDEVPSYCFETLPKKPKASSSR